MLQFPTDTRSHIIRTFVDPASRGRNATIALCIYIATAVAGIPFDLLADPDGDPAGMAAFVQLVAMVPALALVLMWVHRINANAHGFADGLSITPGWNVGWFFVPIANLWKPFTGIRESWQASENPADWPAVPVPEMLRAWWGCWLIGNIVSNASFRLSRAADSGASLARWLDVASSAALIAAAALLIVIIRKLTIRQRHANAAQVFA